MLRFLLDMGIPPKISALLQEEGHASVHALEIGLDTATDRELIGKALESKRIILTTDKDFARLVMIRQYTCPGVITLRLDNPTVEEISTRLRALFHVLKEEEISGALITVQKTKIRRRPI